jgi:predicted SPOUT superfamily RNA methylase MTH1
MPHHLRKTDISPYREGVVIETKDKKHCAVDIGLDENVVVRGDSQVGERVTVRTGSDDPGMGVFFLLRVVSCSS